MRRPSPSVDPGAVAELLDEPTSTTALAARLGVPPSAVDQHLCVMQRAGLLAAEHHGRHVPYRRTTVGDVLGALTLRPPRRAHATAVFLALLLPSLAVTAWRLHDTDRSGWQMPQGLVPVVGRVLMLSWCVQDGTAGHDDVGPSPETSGGRITAAPAGTRS